jgi:beta-glucosidase/6-phospho-beta-glucosidase/beta-galactosidase
MQSTDLSADSIVPERLFRSFLMGGFECSTHKLHSGKRLDMIAGTRHDEFARQDYQRLHSMGMRVAREGVRWHLVEATPGRYDFSSVAPIAQAANATGTQVIWDLCHFGWPDHIDIFKPEFVTHLQNYAAAFAQWHLNELGPAGFFVPINEISFFSWAGGDEGCFNPFATGRGFEMKTQLVRASLATIDAIWSVLPAARFVSIDPIIHVLASPDHPEERQEAEDYRLSQFQAWDMLAGKFWPELGGDDKYLDIIGVNFYFHNEWFYNLRGMQRVRKFKPISPRSQFYRPLRFLLQEVYERYRRPIFIAETGAEDKRRGPWFRHVCGEVKAALDAGIPIHGICLYPIVNHPGWADERHCCNALWDYADDHGRRVVYAPLAKEVRRAQEIFEEHATVDKTAHHVKPVSISA